MGANSRRCFSKINHAGNVILTCISNSLSSERYSTLSSIELSFDNLWSSVHPLSNCWTWLRIPCKNFKALVSSICTFFPSLSHWNSSCINWPWGFLCFSSLLSNAIFSLGYATFLEAKLWISISCVLIRSWFDDK